MMFPDWCPRPLQEAYLTLQAEPPDQWIPADEFKLRMVRFSERFELSVSDQLRGIGNRSTTFQVIEHLGTDLRMKSVWSKLSNLESDARAGRIERVMQLGNETVCCSIASRCAWSMVEEAEVVTRASWKARHEAVARAAAELSELLTPSKSLDPGFQNLALLLTEKQFHDVAGELNGYTRFYSEEDLTERDSLSAPQSEEEIDADNEQWEKEVKDLAYWVEQSMTRATVLPSRDVLNRMAELARFAADRPPFLPPSSKQDRQVFNVCGSLFTYFRGFFARPLDDVVATIASVVVGQDVTTESVKMRRQRWRQHQQR